MAVTIYNHSRTPYQYEIERNNLRWPIPYGENTYFIQDGLRVFQKNQKKHICSWPMSPGLVASDVVTAADMVHQSLTYITITPKGVEPHIPLTGGITQYDHRGREVPSVITEKKPNIAKVVEDSPPPAYDDLFPTN